MKRRRNYLWKELPFIRIIPVFCAGYLLSGFANFNIYYALSCILLATFILMLLKIKSAAFAWKYNAWRGLAIQLLILSLPAILLTLDNKRNGSDHAAIKNHKHFLLTINEPLSEKFNSYSTVAKVSTINDGKLTPVSGAAVVTFAKRNSSKPNISVGDCIVSVVPPSAIAGNKNPGGFDYQKYLSEKGIHYQFFLRSKEWVLIDGMRKKLFSAQIYKLRDAILNTLRKNIKDSSACGLAEALLVGYRNDVDNNLLQAYSNTGVVHVIAISGLHLGLIYIILMKLTSILVRSKVKKILQPVLVISALWIFTLLSGASASVVRSAVMFTVLALGNLIGRKSHSINTLASSAFILLCYHPAWLKDIGFQLSYSAVASILLFHKKILNLYLFSNPLAFKLWEMIALTLAAQILTVPLLLFYFHQFPLLFLFTNLVAVPLSSVILAVELLMCAMSPFTYVASELGNAVTFLIDLMNGYILLMDRIPHSTIQSININLFQTILLYFAIFIIGFPIIINRKWKTYSLLFLLISFFCIRVTLLWQSHQQQKFIVMNTRDISVMGWIEGTEAVYYQSTDTGVNEKRLSKTLDDISLYYRIKKTSRVQYASTTILLIKLDSLQLLNLSGKVRNNPSVGMRADIVILSDNYSGKLIEISAQTRCRLVVADATNGLWKIQEWKKQAEQLHLRFYSIPEQGAFLLDRSQFNPPEAVYAELNHSAR